MHIIAARIRTPDGKGPARAQRGASRARLFSFLCRMPICVGNPVDLLSDKRSAGLSLGTCCCCYMASFRREKHSPVPRSPERRSSIATTSPPSPMGSCACCLALSKRAEILQLDVQRRKKFIFFRVNGRCCSLHWQNAPRLPLQSPRLHLHPSPCCRSLSLACADGLPGVRPRRRELEPGPEAQAQRGGPQPALPLHRHPPERHPRARGEFCFFPPRANPELRAVPAKPAPPRARGEAGSPRRGWQQRELAVRLARPAVGGNSESSR